MSTQNGPPGAIAGIAKKARFSWRGTVFIGFGNRRCAVILARVFRDPAGKSLFSLITYRRTSMFLRLWRGYWLFFLFYQAATPSSGPPLAF